jgi:N-acetylmuramoyl-L-alanine amidase
MRIIKKLVVHCTDSDDSLDVGFNEINDWHKQRGWLSPSGISCGYHYIIKRDGSVQRGRPDIEVGAHVEGHNINSIGIVWVGRNQISGEQYKTLLVLCAYLKHKHNLDVEKVLGHTELNPLKTCPNLNMVKFRGNLIFQRLDSEDASDRIQKILRNTK